MVDTARQLIVAIGAAAGVTMSSLAAAQCHEAFAPIEPGENQATGSGWSGPWAASAHLGGPLELSVVAEASLPVPEGLTPAASGGHLAEFTGLAYRGLGEGQEFDLSASSPWYIRVAVRRTAVGEESKSRGISLLLHDGLKRILTLGCTSSGKLSISGEAKAGSPKPIMGMDHAYVWLIRLDTPDTEGRRRIRMTSYHESQSFPEHEPTNWLLVSEPALIAGTIDRIGIAAGKNVHAEFDELRIAGSWDELNGQ